MSFPSSALVTQRPDLADSFMEFDLMAEQAGYIGYEAMPIIDVAKQAGNFGKIPLEQLLKETKVSRAPGGAYARDRFQFEPATYACQEYGAEEPVDEREAEMYDDYFDAERVATERSYGRVLRAAEKRVADSLFNTATWTGAALTTAVSNEWDENHTTDATPIADVEAAVQKVYEGSGLWPNALIISYTVFRNLRNLDKIIERVQSAGAGDQARAGDITKAQLAQVFDLDYILVGGGSRLTSDEGQDASIAQIWSDEYAMVAKIATGNDFREACVGRTFHWSEDGSRPGGTVEEYEEPQTRSMVYRVRHDVDEVVLYPQAAHLLTNVTTNP